MVMKANRALEFLQAVYNDEELPLLTRVRVAISCLPYEVPKLAVTAIVNEQDFATVLEQRIKRYEKMQRTTKLIDAQPINEPEPTPVPEKPTPAPLNRLYDKRHWRRF